MKHHTHLLAIRTDTRTSGSQSIFWKDTDDKRQHSEEGDARTHSAQAGGGAKRMGLIWNHRLEEYVQDARDEEQYSSYVMNYSHCRFLQTKTRQALLEVTLPYIYIMPHTCWDIPERWQQYTCSDRTATPTPEQFYWDTSSSPLLSHTASPQTCSGRKWWIFLHTKKSDCAFTTKEKKERPPPPLVASQDINSAFTFVRRGIVKSLASLENPILLNKPSRVQVPKFPFIIRGKKKYLHRQRWMSSGQKYSSQGVCQLCHWKGKKGTFTLVISLSCLLSTFGLEIVYVLVCNWVKHRINHDFLTSN